MKTMGRICLILMAMCMFAVGAYAYGGHGKMVTLVTVMNETSFNNAPGAFDNVHDCTINNAYVNAGKEGVMWVNLGAQYYVEGMEILFRYEGGENLGVGVWAECYESYNTGSPLSSWYNDSSVATSNGIWRDIHFKSGSKTVKTQFVKIWLNNKNYTSAVGVGEICIYATPAPGVELEAQNMRIKSSKDVLTDFGAIDKDTQIHAFVESGKMGEFWIELDQPYAIAAVQLDVHSETKDGASLSTWVYFTPEGGTSSGILGRNGPADKNLAFFRGSGHQTYDRVPYSAQYPQDNLCGHHRTHWYTMTHTDGHLGAKAKYVYVVVDNIYNDKPMCIDELHIFRCYDLSSDAIQLSGDGMNPNTYSMAYNGEIQHPNITVTGAQKVVKPSGENINVSYTTTTLKNDPYQQYYTDAAYSDYVIHFPVDSKEVGRYAVTVEGRGIYTGTATAYYNIKYPSQIVLDRNILLMHNVKSSIYRTGKVNVISQVGDGALSVSSQNTSIMKADLSGTTITVTNTLHENDDGFRTADLTVTKAETELYMEAKATIPVSIRQHYLPVGQCIDLSQATLTDAARWFSRETGKDTTDKVLDMMRDRDKMNYAVTKDEDPNHKFAYFNIVFSENKSICDAVLRHATSFPGDLIVRLEFYDENGVPVCENANTKTYCNQQHRTMRVFPSNESVIENVRKVTVVVDFSGLSGTKEAHIYEIGFYEPVEADRVFSDPENARLLNTVSADSVQKTVNDYIDEYGWNLFEHHALDNAGWHDPDIYYPGRFYVPIPNVHQIAMEGGQYGTVSDGAYMRNAAYQDALGVMEDNARYTAQTDMNLLFMRGTGTFVTGQNAVYGDNATFVNDTVVESDTQVISYSGDWKNGDEDEAEENRFSHAKVIYVTKDTTGKAQFNVFLKASQRVEITTDIGPYQGRVNVTLSKGGTVYCTDYIDGFFPVNAQNMDKYKVSNMTGTAMDERNERRNDYWNESQINVFTAPETGLYTVTLDVPWDSYLVSGLGGRYAIDAPACNPCTVIDSIRVLPADEEWNFSFSETQTFLFGGFEHYKCNTSMENGCVRIDVLGNDHNVFTMDHLNWDASLYKAIEVVVEYDIKNHYYTQVDGVVHQDKAQIFFTRNDSGSMNQAMSVAVDLPTVSTNGKFIVLKFPVGNNAEWRGTIRRLRFDLNNGPQGTHHIRAIRLVRYDE